MHGNTSIQNCKYQKTNQIQIRFQHSEYKKKNSVTYANKKLNMKFRKKLKEFDKNSRNLEKKLKEFLKKLKNPATRVGLTCQKMGQKKSLE